MNIHCTADKYNFTFSHQVSRPVQKRGRHPAYAFLHTVPFWKMPASPFTVLWSFFLPILWSSVQPGHQGWCWGATEQHCTRLRGKYILRLSCFQRKGQQAAIGRTSENPGRTHQEYQLLLKETIAGGCHEFKENGRASQSRFRLPHLHSLCPLGFRHHFSPLVSLWVITLSSYIETPLSTKCCGTHWSICHGCPYPNGQSINNKMSTGNPTPKIFPWS